MIVSIIIFVIIFTIGLIFSIVKINNKNTEDGLNSLILTTGISLISSSLTDFWNWLFATIALLKGKEQLASSTMETNYYTLTIGVIFIGIYIFLCSKLKNKFCILNINGYDKYNIDEYVNTKKDIYSYTEREINFIYLYNNLFKKRHNKEILKCILNQIEDNTKSFKSETNGLKKGYTGIAPIPFIIYAGTFLNRTNIDKYLEFNKKTSKYYELSNKKVKYPKLINEYKLEDLDKKNNGITLVVSITQQITEEDLSQFKNTNIVKLGIRDKKDNAIYSKKQLEEYTNNVIDTIIKLENSGINIKKINLILASQSCLAIEIGKRCADDTRLPEVISYQYERQENNNRYPWGIVINGKNKGNFIKEELNV